MVKNKKLKNQKLYFSNAYYFALTYTSRMKTMRTHSLVHCVYEEVILVT